MDLSRPATHRFFLDFFLDMAPAHSKKPASATRRLPAAAPCKGCAGALQRPCKRDTAKETLQQDAGLCQRTSLPPQNSGKPGSAKPSAPCESPP